MADATDLKSVPANAGYGFESHHRHLQKSDFTSGNTGFEGLDSLLCILPDKNAKMLLNRHYVGSILAVTGILRRSSAPEFLRTERKLFRAKNVDVGQRMSYRSW